MLLLIGVWIYFSKSKARMLDEANNTTTFPTSLAATRRRKR